jgi:hypothetical protein
MMSPIAAKNVPIWDPWMRMRSWRRKRKKRKMRIDKLDFSNIDFGSFLKTAKNESASNL